MRFYAWLLAIGLALGLDGQRGVSGETPAPNPGSDGTEQVRCSETEQLNVIAGAELGSIAKQRKGVRFDADSGILVLEKESGDFTTTALPLEEKFKGVCAGDFDQDGWDDLIGVDTELTLTWLRNETGSVPEPDWTMPNAVRAPKFRAAAKTRSQAAISAAVIAIGCGDMNGDGFDDVFIAAAAERLAPPKVATMYLGNGNGGFLAQYQFVDQLASLANLGWSSNVVVTDQNGDGRLDMLWALAGSRDSGGKIDVFLNDAGANPIFAPKGSLVEAAKLGERGPLGVAWRDVDGDELPDLIYAGSETNSLRIHRGLGGGKIEAAYRSVAHPGAPSGDAALLASDLTSDGRVELIVVSADPSRPSRAQVHYYGNSAHGQPFDGDAKPMETTDSGASEPVTVGADPVSDASTGSATYSSGVIAKLDYDKDPGATPDLVLADGRYAGGLTIVRNRKGTHYVECGVVRSAPIDLGELANLEMVVTGARIEATVDLNGGTMQLFASTQTPASWVPAETCPAKDGYCVRFPDATGTQLRWQARLCSTADRASSPKLSAMRVAVDYERARIHYRAGVVVANGIAYVGGFSQPGYRGSFAALTENLDKVLWQASTDLDARSDSSRTLYTSSTATDGGLTREDFRASNAEALVTTLNASSAEQAARIIDWLRRARFGIVGSRKPLSRLGAIETSTPAIVSPPPNPVWLQHADSETRSAIEEFRKAAANRKTLAIVGSRNGTIQAFRAGPTTAGESGGTEAWAYLPTATAAKLAADVTLETPRAFPDGSVALGDVRDVNGAFMTVAIVGSGRGGYGVTALDVTDSETRGPRPLWETRPGEADAGPATVKPTIARVQIGGRERFFAILASGPDPGDERRGMQVVAVDAVTGALAWRFRALCPVTSDLTVFETDDENEVGKPQIDGYIDRLVFADKCGNVYKLEPGLDLGPASQWSLSDGWLDSSQTGVVATGRTGPDGSQIKVLFSTQRFGSPKGLGEERPVAGTIGAIRDSSSRVTLMFGTGGVASFSPSKRNQFYAIYADTGEVRSVLQGACSARGLCEKFYGGVVVGGGQVLITRSTDPEVSVACDRGSGVVTGLDINADDAGNFVVKFATKLGAASTAPLFGVGGAIYTSTVAGTLVRIGSPTARSTGSSESSDSDQAKGRGNGLEMLSWRQLY